ncbi:hypothetical protein B0A48_09669 [Cryoendolithus antarcticus]|uniref:Uncharacterized protein n=1 Tax=Cryoendolithus antarcticus TaxID=1507870 RepID=A0A1V8T005_9PEZI|nr:hypothetical protein B0A48_09669 [Cryoendolithus antarcticus]
MRVDDLTPSAGAVAVLPDNKPKPQDAKGRSKAPEDLDRAQIFAAFMTGTIATIFGLLIWCYFKVDKLDHLMTEIHKGKPNPKRSL